MSHTAQCIQCHTQCSVLSESVSWLQVLQQIEEQKINIYQFPDTDYDEEEAAANRRLKVQWGGL